MRKTFTIPEFFIDSFPEQSETECRVLLRHTEIKSTASYIYPWLTQFRIAPYSYDILDNRHRRSPHFIIDNLPPLKLNSHFLLAFHIFGFRENSFIAGRFCLPVNPPVSRYLKEMFIEYRIQELGTSSMLWCKVRAELNATIASRGFFFVFSVINRMMTKRQLRNVKRLAENLAAGNIRNGIINPEDYHSESGLLWWICCRRHQCNGLPVMDGTMS